MRETIDAMLVSLHEHFKVRITDWLLSAILLSWGLALFAVDPRIWALPTFTGLNQLAPQWVWAMGASLIGFVRIIALFVNGAVRRSPHLRMFGAFAASLLWFELSLGIFHSDLVGPEIAIVPWLVLADVFNVYRAAKDAWASDQRASLRRRLAAANRAPAT